MASIQQLQQIERLKQELDNERQHSNRLEEQIKVWAYSLNKLGIGVRLVGEWIVFRRSDVDIRMLLTDVLVWGIPAIIAMFEPIRVSVSDPQNLIDGVEGWKHPEIVEEEQEAARTKANEALGSIGMHVRELGIGSKRGD